MVALVETERERFCIGMVEDLRRSIQSSRCRVTHSHPWSKHMALQSARVVGCENATQLYCPHLPIPIRSLDPQVDLPSVSGSPKSSPKGQVNAGPVRVALKASTWNPKGIRRKGSWEASFLWGEDQVVDQFFLSTTDSKVERNKSSQSPSAISPQAKGRSAKSVSSGIPRIEHERSRLYQHGNRVASNSHWSFFLWYNWQFRSRGLRWPDGPAKC